MARRQFAASTYGLLHRHHCLGISHDASMLVGWCSVAEIVSCGQGAIRRCAGRRRDRADDESADVVGGIPRCRGRMVSDVAVENMEWAGRGIPNVYHCRCGVLGCGATRANSRLVGNRKAQKLLNRSEKKFQAKNTPHGCLKDQRWRAVRVGMSL